MSYWVVMTVERDRYRHSAGASTLPTGSGWRAEFRRSLHLVRKIRNKFAHRVSTMALNESPCRDLISELTKPIPSPTFWDAVMQQEYGDERDPRVEFQVIVAVYAYILESALILSSAALFEG